MGEFIMDIKKELELIEAIAMTESEESVKQQKDINETIIKITEILDGYDKLSKKYALEILERIINNLPLTPLTGKDDEWELVGKVEDVNFYKNKRYEALLKLIKDDDSKRLIVDTGKYLVSEDLGRSWEYAHHYNYPDILEDRFKIQFPYLPESPVRVFVKIDEDGKTRILSDEELPI